MNRRPSTHIYLLYRVYEPPKVSVDHVRKRHPNRPVVLAEENGQLQDGVRHIFSHVPGSLGKPGNLRNDSAPRKVGSVVQNYHEVPPRRHRVGGDIRVIDGSNEECCWPSWCRVPHLEGSGRGFENRGEECLRVGSKCEPNVTMREHVFCPRGWGRVVRTCNRREIHI
jgi:hypothetical protein